MTRRFEAFPGRARASAAFFASLSETELMERDATASLKQSHRPRSEDGHDD